LKHRPQLLNLHSFNRNTAIYPAAERKSQGRPAWVLTVWLSADHYAAAATGRGGGVRAAPCPISAEQMMVPAVPLSCHRLMVGGLTLIKTIRNVFGQGQNVSLRRTTAKRALAGITGYLPTRRSSLNVTDPIFIVLLLLRDIQKSGCTFQSVDKESFFPELIFSIFLRMYRNHVGFYNITVVSFVFFGTRK